MFVHSSTGLVVKAFAINAGPPARSRARGCVAGTGPPGLTSPQATITTTSRRRNGSIAVVTRPRCEGQQRRCRNNATAVVLLWQDTWWPEARPAAREEGVPVRGRPAAGHRRRTARRTSGRAACWHPREHVAAHSHGGPEAGSLVGERERLRWELAGRAGEAVGARARPNCPGFRRSRRCRGGVRHGNRSL